MGFPTVASSATSKQGSYNATDFVVTMPSGIVAGDLLAVVVAWDVGAERNYATPSGWTQVSRIFGNTSWEAYLYAKEAVGSDTMTLAKGGASAAGVAIAYRITGSFGGGLADLEAAAFVGGFSDTGDPPSLTPSWGATDVLWIAASIVAGTNAAPTAYPSSYADNQLSDATNGVTKRLSAATRGANGSSEDPGAFTYAATPPYGQRITIAVRGTAPAGPVITGPAGAAGAPSITHAVNENQNNAGTWSATGGTAWSLTGTDAGLLSISAGGVVTLASGNFDHEAKASYSFNVLRDAVAQAVTLNITDQAEAPLAPTIGTATAGNASASVAFTAPNNTGRPAITGYTATSSPGGLTGTGASSPITVSGLANGTPYTFTVTATNDEGTGPPSAASNSVTPSSGNVAPSIITQPSSTSVTAPTAGVFTAAASGTPTPTVQWQRNPGGTGSWANVSGATSTTLTTGATSVSGGSWNSGDQVRAVFTNSEGSATSSAATLTVSAAGTAPTITVQPASQTVTAGATATFSVTATGSGLTYQWRRNGSNIGGATSASYTTPATTVSGGSANNGDVYSVVVTGDTAPAATSANATLTVNAPAPPPPPPPPPPTGPTLPAVATDATGSTRRTGQTTRMVVEPFTSIEALGTGVRTIATGTTDAVTGEITLTGLAAGTYAVFGFFPSTGATIDGVRFRLVTVT